ncbi:nucleotide-binding universal stress UspA family protein [Paraburkholderia unamae]|uniref:universal stress protein n=1 Tax=Paraburkholderia unamae TaxID=219649 RepID=UPI000DC2E3DD|nr:universal stress protein [Paraburkholderia unamae]RAR68200.1 nucleotide-binding universal stress UspA family protein [Paraburkholderia unamae]
MSREEDQAQYTTPLRRIMIAVDDSTASMQAVRFAGRVTPRDAEVRIVCAAGEPRAWMTGGAYSAGSAWMTDAIADARSEFRRDAERTLELAMKAFTGRAASVEGQVVGISGEAGAVVQVLTETARDWRADMLLVGARHQGRMKRWVDGSVSGALAVCAPCPLLVVPVEYEQHGEAAQGAQAANGEVHLARILMAADGSPASAQAMRAAARLAGPQTALRAVYVVDRSSVSADPVPGSVLEDALADLGRKALAAAREELEPSGCAAETALVATGLMHDDIAHAVLRDAQSWNADLVVLGTQGRRGVARWLLGSVAQRAIEITHLPLLLVGPGAA